MKIAVLGAAGLMAPSAMRDLIKQKDVESILALDIDESKVKALTASLQDPRISGVTVDVTDTDRLRKVLQAVDVAANCVSYRLNLKVMEACLRAGCHYLDLGGLFHTTKEQLQLDREFKKAGLLAVLGMGGSPGLTNVMARYGADRLDAVEDISIRVGSVDLGQHTGPFIFPYTLDTIVDELIKPAAIYENGELSFVEPLSRTETVNFLNSVGAKETGCTLHSELATFPATFSQKGIKNCSFKIAFEPTFLERLRFLIQLGLIEKKPIDVHGNPITPWEVLDAILKRLPLDTSEPNTVTDLRVVVRGSKDKKPTGYTIDAMTESDPLTRENSTALSTALPASVVALMIGRGVITETGVLPPESVIPPETCFESLSSRGIKIHCCVHQVL